MSWKDQLCYIYMHDNAPDKELFTICCWSVVEHEGPESQVFDSDRAAAMGND